MGRRDNLRNGGPQGSGGGVVLPLGENILSVDQKGLRSR